MRPLDILRMAGQDLWQRKLRTCLNLVGIVIGSVMLLLTAAGANGSRDALRRLFDSSELVRQIWVTPKYFYAPEPPDGEIAVDSSLSPERELRIREAMVNQWKIEHQEPGLSSLSVENIDALARLPHVLRVIPDANLHGTIKLEGTQTIVAGHLRGIDVHASKYSSLLLAGNTLEVSAQTSIDDPSQTPAENEVLVSEWLAYRLGYRSDEDLEALLGKRIVLEHRTGGNELNYMYSMLSEQFTQSAKNLAEQAEFAIAFQSLLKNLDNTDLSEDQKELIRGLTQKFTNGESGRKVAKLKTQAFTIRGVIHVDETSGSPGNLFKMWFHRSEGDLFAHYSVAKDLQLEDPERQDFPHALVVVESASHLKAVSESIREMKMEPVSAEWLWDNIQRQIDNVTKVVYGLAAAVLLASALGISNTLLISVLQRTPEFGILKSVGARDRDLLLLMLSEGILLGLLGSTIAILVGVVIALAGHQVLAAYITSRSGEQVTGLLFDFSLTSIGIVYLAATSICIVASILPAWRAARLDPIVAMRRT